MLRGTSDPFQRIHLLALCLCAIFLPWSTAFLSMSEMLLVANWIVRGIVRHDARSRWRSSFTSAPPLVFMSFLGLHLLGLLWTTDVGWGMDLCRILAPVLVFGAVLGGSERLSRNELRTILLFGAWSALASAFFGQLFSDARADDYRAVSMFISHIRLALLLALAVVFFLWFRHSRMWINVAQWMGALAALWCIARLGSIQSFIVLVLIALVVGWRWTASLRPTIAWSVRTLIVLIPLASTAVLLLAVKDHRKPIPPGLGRTVEYTVGGERYEYDTTNAQTENGHHVWSYIAWRELRRTWARRSDRSLDELDDRGHGLASTCVRYMASKDLRKDSLGVLALTDEDVRAIEGGATSAFGDAQGLRARLDEVLFELDLYRDRGIAEGHSVAMRFEFVKAGWAIAKANWTLGVGTGDTQRAFDAHYEATNSALSKAWRLRAHNEYLTLWISFGVFGLLWALFSLWWPALQLGAWRNPLFIAWAIAFGISCLTDDTPETQAGATFFALYYALFVFAAPKKADAG